MTKTVECDREQEEKTIEDQILLMSIIYSKEYTLNIVHGIKTGKVISLRSE